MEEMRGSRRAERDWERRAEQYREEERREIIGEQSRVEERDSRRAEQYSMDAAYRVWRGHCCLGLGRD
jgi:hypothetical protein